ncbi:MAG: HDIG domain-containing protein [Candidatus Kapabacteria bacterium]|nr:HDIG domain-containing protein [Candidatus Kapabacteria bacterium]MDW8011574.1 HDIG domain-containing protein [Bacteroidota bacterium]
MATPTLFARLQQRLRTTEEGEGIRFSVGLRVAIIGATVLLCGLFFPWWTEEVPPQWVPQWELVGTRWRGPVVQAEYSFVVRKPTEVYEQEVRRALDSVAPVFVPLSNARSEWYGRIALVVDSLRRVPSLSEGSVGAEQWGGEQLEMLQRIAERVFREVAGWEVIDRPKGQIPTPWITLWQHPTVWTTLPLGQVLDSAEGSALLRTLVRRYSPPELERLVAEVVQKAFRPTLVYNEKLTDSLRWAVRQSIPRTWGVVREGELIVAPGDVITDTTVAKLASYANARLLQRERRVTLSTLMGSFGHAALICSVLFVYLGFLRPRILRDALQLAGLAVGLVAIAALAWLSRVAKSDLPLEYLIVVPALSMLVAILLDSRTAFYTTVTAALLVAGVRNGDYSTGLALMLGGMLAAYTVRDLESRRQLFRSLFFIALGIGTAAVVLGIAQGRSLEDVLLRCGFVAANAGLSPVLTFGILLLLERTFNIVTDMRLLEYSSLEHPLLQELQRKAPGTYQHTLNVARLAEHAARAIGARALLVRVGAYFHDIGKLTKPEYFAENQIGLDNKHERLPPKKSAAIIREHVTEGIDLARSYGLPPQIVDFIPQHHGTMLIRAFWQKAVEQARQRGEPPPSEEDFRYFGPKPQTKEAAILMLADAAEALTHALPSQEPDRLAAALDEVIRERIVDGQLDESPLSFHELQKVRDALVEGMVGIQHRRVSYGAATAQPAALL